MVRDKRLPDVSTIADADYLAGFLRDPSIYPLFVKQVAEVNLAAQTFTGIRTQSWDIALTEPVPTLLELNFGCDLNLHQLAQGQGVLDDQYRNHLRRCGYKGKL